jgi:hypothetical protein
MKKILLLNYFKAVTSRNPRKNTTRFNGLLALFVMVMGMGVSWGQVTFFSYTNTTASIPSDWTLTNNVSTNLVDRSTYLLLDAGSPSDLITSGNIDLSSYSYVILNVQVATFGSGTNRPLRVDISTASGSTFTSVANYISSTPTTSSYIAGGPIVIPAPSGGFTSTTKLRFSNNGTSGTGVRIQSINLVSPTQASNVIYTTIGTTSFTVNWTDGSNSSAGRRVVFIAATSSGSALPVNGITYTANTTFGSGTQIGSTGWYCVYNNTGTHASGVSITGLTNGTTYRVMVCENEGSGATSVYNTTSASNNPNNQTTTSVSSNSTASDIITQSGYSYTSNIDYASKQAASTLTIANSVGVNGLTLRDGGATSDSDALGTTLTDVTFSTGGSTAIRTAALFDGTNKIAEVAVNGSTSIAFTSLSLSATDGGTKDFELRVTFQSSVTDNQQITFTVSSATASASTSGFAAADAGAAASSVNGDNNRIEVTASALAFVAQPANTLVSASMTNVTVSANDALANRDLDFTSSVRITSTGTLTGTPVDVTASSGLATFTSLTHTASGSSLTLNAERTSALDWDVTSSAFDVTVQAPGLLLLEDNFTHSAILTSNGYTALNGTGTNDLTAGATGLSYSNYGSSNIGNALVVANTGQDVSRTFTQQNSPTSIYASFLVNVSAAQTGDYFFAFTPSSSSSNFRARTFIKVSSNAGFFNLGISNSGTVNYNVSPTDYAINTTHLVVVKYTFTSNTTATATVFVNPSTSSEPSIGEVSFTDNTGANVPADITSFAIRQGTSSSAPTMVIDGIRIATNWGALMGNPQYNSSTNIAAGNYNTVNIITGTVTATGNITVNGTTTNDGVINIGANTLTVNGSVTGSGTLTGGATSNLTTTGTTGTLYFDQTTPGTTNLLKNFTISSGSVALGNALNITAGSSAGVLTVGASATLSTSGNLTLKSDVNGTARVSEVGSGGAITGNVTVERYLPARRAWRLLTAPLKGSSNNSIYANWQGVNDEGVLLWGPAGTATPTSSNSGLFQGPQANIWSYSNGWNGNAVSNTNTSLLFSTKNNAYLVYATGPSNSNNIASNTGASITTLRPKGELITGTVNYTGLTSGQFHLLGNPYASPIDIARLRTSNSSFTFYLLDPSLGDANSRGGYYTYNGSWTPNTPSNALIQSGQGFFVKSASATTFDVTESHKDSGNSNMWFDRTTADTSVDKIRVLLFKQDNSEWYLADGILTVNSASGNNEVDAADADKMINFDENLFFKNGGSNLAIENRGLPAAGMLQPMQLTGTTAQPYELRIKTENYSNSNLTPYLENIQTGVLTAIPTDGSEVIVSFTGMAATSAAPDSRFRIVYQAPLSADDLNSLVVGVYPNPVNEGLFTIELANTNAPASYTLTNLLGQEVQKGTLMALTNAIAVQDLSKGVYLLQINQEGKRFSTKLMIK